MEPLLQSSLTEGVLPLVVYGVSALALVALLLRRPLRRWFPTSFAAAFGGAAIGWALAWLTGDVWNLYDVSLTFATRAAFSLGVAGIAIAAVSFHRATARRRVLAAVSIVVFALFAGVGINADVGEFPTVGALVSSTGLPPLEIPGGLAAASASPLANWREPAGMPAAGRVGTVTIPATESGFVARAAVVYLPPAALVAHPPQLPVMELMSGQPGEPADLITSGQLSRILDGYARVHRGLAPVVVVPDQLGSAGSNPMCLDSPLGQSAAYLTVDVPNWIRSHLNVIADRDSWAIGGFSQGGTCSIQLGTVDRALYGSILDIAGQEAPLRGTVAATIADGFGGSSQRYRAATAEALLAAGAPFSTTRGFFVVGQDDAKYGPGAARVAAAALASGMDTTSLVSPGTAHDWRTVRYAFRQALPLLFGNWGLR